MIAYSLYLHFPFCRRAAATAISIPTQGRKPASRPICRLWDLEAQSLAAALEETIPVHTLFLGGGTPSLLPPDLIEAFLQALEPSYTLAPDLEFTLEANPGTLSPATLASLRALGVNRMSLGMQSAHPGELALLDRRHDY